MRPRPGRSMAFPTSTSRMPSRWRGSTPSSRARSRSFNSRCRCSAISRSCPPRCWRRNPRRRRWRGRCTRRSRSSKRSSDRGITWQKARTTNSSQDEERPVTTERRRFIATAGGVVAAAATSAIVDAPNVIAQPKVQWRLSTAYPPALDHLHGAAQQLAKSVEETSSGRFRIEVFASGQIVQAFECFDAASKGTIEAFMAAPVYWAEKEPAIEWFGTIPFGMNPQGMTAWYHQGDGLKLWEEIYAAYNLVPRQGPTFAPQMAGWFRKKLTSVADDKGLKVRMGSNLARKVVTKAGATTVLTPAADIYAALERGVIDVA